MQFKGDIDGDGKLTSMDVEIVFMYKTSEVNLTEGEITRGDVDNSGGITLADARKILKHITGIELIDEVIE